MTIINKTMFISLEKGEKEESKQRGVLTIWNVLFLKQGGEYKSVYYIILYTFFCMTDAFHNLKTLGCTKKKKEKLDGGVMLQILLPPDGCNIFHPIYSYNVALTPLPSRGGVSTPSPWNWVGFCECFGQKNMVKVTSCDFQTRQ